MIKIVFYTSDMPHPNEEGVTIYDVSVKLEKRYKLLYNFFEYIKPTLIKKIKNEYKRSPNPKEQVINEWLKNRWREWILDGNYGIITQASKKRGNQSFVDTGAYYMSMYPKVILDSDSQGGNFNGRTAE